jgi:16S rRNA (cytosine967-C5)-methyltransferase
MEIVKSATEVLNPEGVFGSATCSPHFAETLGQVKRILKEIPEL